MEFWHGFLLITGIHLLAAASPGPDFIFVSQQTLSRGWTAGLVCALRLAALSHFYLIHYISCPCLP